MRCRCYHHHIHSLMKNDGFQNHAYVQDKECIPVNANESVHSFENDSSLVGYTGPLRTERRTSLVQMSGPLYIGSETENSFRPAPAAVVHKPTTEKYPSLAVQSEMFHNVLYGDAKGWMKRTCSFLHPYIPGVMNPHAKIVQKWNKFFVISCLFAVFIDPLFFFLLYVHQGNKCIVLNWPLTTTIVILRSITDIIYLMHILLQFRLAYVAPESMVVGAIIILLILPKSIASSGANYAKNLLRAAILLQYIPRLCRFLPLLAGQSPRVKTCSSQYYVVLFLLQFPIMSLVYDIAITFSS
ncbi:hypothetical protein HAX54_035427 [Datura stramonium]|uniref:Ion transport domain-containing protein n=1 Tax=Datura stramonium TaxID=4076 RepID=A0ABS8SG82_DATST|nr:hypothetical protein [Datura stramonium]